jgi:hypothetical protein
VPDRRIAGSAGEQRQPATEPAGQRRRGQDVHPRHRQRDRQGEAVQTGADVEDDRGVLRRQREVRIDGPRPLDEEGHGRVPGQGRRAR